MYAVPSLLFCDRVKNQLATVISIKPTPKPTPSPTPRPTCDADLLDGELSKESLGDSDGELDGAVDEDIEALKMSSQPIVIYEGGQEHNQDSGESLTRVPVGVTLALPTAELQELDLSGTELELDGVEE